MVVALLIIIAVLLLALWVSAMALWWRSEQELAAELAARDVIRHWNKARRMARRSLYTSLRYTKRATEWGNKKARKCIHCRLPCLQVSICREGLADRIGARAVIVLLGESFKKRTSRKQLARKKLLKQNLLSKALLKA